jgi:hypothetical protein
MWSAATVITCALAALGRDASTLPPIELVETRPAGVSKNAEAFTRGTSNVIYLITSSTAFKTAQDNRDYSAVAKIASVIVHEEWHLRHGLDENGAYDAQLLALTRLGRGPGTTIYDEVWRSKLAALRTQRPNVSANALAFSPVKNP